MTFRTLSLISFSVLLSFSPKKDNATPSNSTQANIHRERDKETRESFEEFNVRFHTDSAFQLSRVAFPIGGKYVDGEESYTWTRQNWVLLREPVKDSVTNSEYNHSVEIKKDTVVERYWIDSSGFLFESHFVLKGDKWFLTYCNDINL